MTPDANVLVSAFRPDHPHHQPAQKWLDEAVRQAANGQASFSLMGMVVTGFMRITSNPKIFKQTDPLADVCGFIECAECLTRLHDCGGDPRIGDQITLDLLRQTQLAHGGPRGRQLLKLHAWTA
jgi:predicted nucleic acid-binding protein